MYTSSRRNNKRSGGGSTRKRKTHRKIRIPPTIYEVNEDHWDKDGNELHELSVNHPEMGDADTDKHFESNTLSQSPVVDLSILEDEEAANKRSQSCRKSKKIYFDDFHDWDDSSSDSSAKTHDSLRVHTCAFQKKDSNKLKGDKSGLDHHGNHYMRLDKNGKNHHHYFRKRPCSKVQTIVRLLERIGSGSSFNSSEGPSDSSKHNMKVWENAFRGQESKARKRSVGFNLKKLFSFSNKNKHKQNNKSNSHHHSRLFQKQTHCLDRRVFDIRKLSL